MKHLGLALLALGLFGCATQSHAQVMTPQAAGAPVAAPIAKSWPPAPDSLTLTPVDTLRQDSAGPTLVNGFLAVPSDWPATFFATLKDSQAWNCTTTLIGPQVLLAAAHCVADGGNVSILREGRTYTGTCERPQPGYPDPISADWLLCAMDTQVPAFRYERVSLDPSKLRHDQTVTLGGGGCTVVGGVADGQFRIGPASIAQLPGEYGGAGEKNWIVTHEGTKTGESFICEGDSGGAVYFSPSGTSARFVVAVNSHRDTLGRGVAFLSAMYTPAAIDFIQRWQKKHGGLAICGVPANAQNGVATDAQDCR